MDKEITDFQKKTRDIFHKIHVQQSESDLIFNRLISLLSPSYLKVEDNFFEDKICLDAGCGSNANATFAMLSMGAKKVYAFDLDESFIEPAQKRLKKFDGRYVLSTDDVLKTKFKDNFFDFVNCSGVLHHTGKKVIEGLKELKRITKNGGILYFMVNGKGGIIREFTNFLRERYIKDDEFKKIIDDLNEEKIRKEILFIYQSMIDHKDDLVKEEVPKALIELLFDRDLILTIQDRIQAPIYTETTEEELRTWLNENGFVNIKRLKRYPKYSNLRRFLSPLYDEYDNELSRFLFGDGMIQLIATKKSDLFYLLFLLILFMFNLVLFIFTKISSNYFFWSHFF